MSIVSKIESIVGSLNQTRGRSKAKSPAEWEEEIRLVQWQCEICYHHSRFIRTTKGCTPKQCFCDALIDADGDFDKLGEYDIGYGILCQKIVDLVDKNWCAASRDDLISNPVMFVLIAQNYKQCLDAEKRMECQYNDTCKIPE
jgi:hypothetical protein